MLPIKTIVVVLNAGSEQQVAWDQASAWAGALGGRLHVVLPVAPDVREGLTLAEGLQAMAEHNAEVSAGHWLSDFLRHAGVDAGQTVVASTDWAETVLHEARRLEADLLVVADGHDLRPLLRQLPCPLLRVRHAQPPRRLAAALGAGAADAPHRLLNLALLEHLSALAPSFAASARVLSVLPNPVELVPLMGDAYAASYASADLEAVYKEELCQQLAGFGLAEEALMLAAGRPDMVLPELVAGNHVDCLLLGTVARKGFAAFWLGNTAEEVLPRLDCNVLLLRPQDYYDPA